MSCYGALGYTTPNIDRLGSEGTRFTNFLTTQAVCTASRAALLTGCYPNRLSLSGALMPWATNGLHPDEETLAELLRERGYATGAFGKRHLGHHPEFLPRQQGFDEYFGLPYSNDMWPVNDDGTSATSGQKGRFPLLPMIDGDSPVDTIRTLFDQDQLTRRLTERAVGLINKHRNGKPSGRRNDGYPLGMNGIRGENTENYATEAGLYDLRHDPGERYDISKQHPELKKDLESLAEKARADLGDDIQKRKGANVRAGRQVSTTR
ncbi:MAG: sulfatase-like hydrolase/transferase [Rudanella sp.]|nr:sulfatase-like hydrolase/transferase [Rudanella sp.]